MIVRMFCEGATFHTCSSSFRVFEYCTGLIHENQKGGM
ncbi:hypothetical protein SC09_Contig24orf00058 [Bacillus subtilis]|uniref:Uncharacterized protein n=1 Tax=Bacillus subtilis TaxID=1423 RepID=A0A0D1IPC8_BACIU|nr:hypothetical protein SC09_Contig24orf00058 [Bacillus subtilis]